MTATAASLMTSPAADPVTVTLRLHGQVQGVGMRPAVARLANRHGLGGDVANDAAGVCIRLQGASLAVAAFESDLKAMLKRHGRHSPIERCVDTASQALPAPFAILDTPPVTAKPAIGALHLPLDRGICERCLREVRNPLDRRFRYAMNGCAECGPRYSMLQELPFERHHGSMQAFLQCPACLQEYQDPAHRRLHAQSNGCHVCGPQVQLVRMDGHSFSVEQFTHLDAVDAATTLIQRGEIIAVQGIGGFHLVCDATDAAVVQRLRDRKHRPSRPLALMVRDVEVLSRYATATAPERQALASSEAPIVLLPAVPGALPENVAPGLDEVGCMLPYTALHHLLLRRLDRPVVMTSANASGNPQCEDLESARRELDGIADWLLCHDRRIVHRIDDSLIRVRNGQSQVLRRARGLAPLTLPLPSGFEAAGQVLAAGGHLKSTLCLLHGRHALLSPHVGDLASPGMREAYAKSLQAMTGMYQFQPDCLAVDLHPEYASAAMARAAFVDTEVVLVQHHHAHAAACMAEHQRPLHAAPVLAVVFDGLGMGEQGELWGGEFLLADYTSATRLASLQPMSLPGGELAMRQPWRNLLAQIETHIGWQTFRQRWAALPLTQELQKRPVAAVLEMLRAGVNSPTASSAGRLFDAVACALGLPAALHGTASDTGELGYEGEAAMQLQALAQACDETVSGYPLSVAEVSGRPVIQANRMWQALFTDLAAQVSRERIALSFHQGLAHAAAEMVRRLYEDPENNWAEPTVVLSGGSFQNPLLESLLVDALQADGFEVLCHRQIPASDGGLALGQAVVAAARGIAAGGQH